MRNDQDAFIIVALLSVLLLWMLRGVWKYHRAEKETRMRLTETSYRHTPRRYPVLTAPSLRSCGHSSPPCLVLPLDHILFCDLSTLTASSIMLNGETVHCAFDSKLQKTFGMTIRTLGDVERIASRYPASDWLLRITEPLQSCVYQRHGDGQWNLIYVDNGLA